MNRSYSRISAFLIFFLCTVPLWAGITQKDQEAIEQRAQELAPSLTASPRPLVPHISDRAAWEAFGKIPSQRSKVQEAEKILETPIADLPEELYKEFYENGNRSHYEKARNDWCRRLHTLTLAELIENKGRFLPALEEVIRKFCDYPSWSLPAHDKGARIYDGKEMGADLFGTHIAANLAILRLAMEGVLSPEVSDLIAENVRRRVVEPCRFAICEKQNSMMGWITCQNNWNPVCFCGTLAAALSVCESPEERAWYLAAAEHFVSIYFFSGFTDDGYCSEGIGYWSYGFGNFARLAEIAWRASDGRVNLFTCPKVKAVTEYALKMETAPNCYAAFADCSTSARPEKEIIALMSRRLGLGLKEIEQTNGYPNVRTYNLVEAAAYGFPQYGVPGKETAVPSATVETQNPVDLPITYFSDAGIMICRAVPHDATRLSAVFKGGNNGEQHNHNDLGTFAVLLDGEWLITDPGGESYTARTFSNRRYEGELLNSFGHPVPRINGQLQKTGADVKAEVIEASFSDSETVFALDLTEAYSESGAEKVTRKFIFKQTPAGEPNSLTVTDTIQFKQDAPKTAEVPVITYQDWKKEETPGTFTISAKPGKNQSDPLPAITVTVTAENGNGNRIEGTLAEEMVGKDDPQVGKKPTRISLTADAGTENTLIFTTTIRPVIE